MLLCTYAESSIAFRRATANEHYIEYTPGVLLKTDCIPETVWETMNGVMLGNNGTPLDSDMLIPVEGVDVREVDMVGALNGVDSLVINKRNISDREEEENNALFICEGFRTVVDPHFLLFSRKNYENYIVDPETKYSSCFRTFMKDNHDSCLFEFFLKNNKLDEDGKLCPTALLYHKSNVRDAMLTIDDFTIRSVLCCSDQCKDTIYCHSCYSYYRNTFRKLVVPVVSHKDKISLLE
jgi:hypothetical protein